MGKISLSAKTFNGEDINIDLEIFIDGLIIINKKAEKDSIISTYVRSKVRESVLKSLKEYFPKLEIKSVDFKLISLDLKNLKTLMVKPNSDQLAIGISKYIISSICDTLSVKQEKLSAKEDEFKAKYLQINPKKDLVNTDLARSIQLYKERKRSEAFELVVSIKTDELTNDEIEYYDLLQFSLFLNNKTKDSKTINTKFKRYIKQHEASPALVKEFYFEYIRFLQDSREFKKPRLYLQEFQEKYPISILSDDELSIYHYINGRAEYYRGEFLVALQHLTTALAKANKNDKRAVAEIYNTSANSFTDNLFFHEAEMIAEKAYKLRKMHDLPEQYDTLGCLAGINFKRTDYKKAMKIQSEVLVQSKKVTLTSREKNRIYNYMAKYSIMADDYKSAEEYLNEAESAGDPSGFSNEIRLLMFCKQKKYKEMEELYKSTLMLPENHKLYDNFALGWGYVLMAIASFEQNNYNDGIIYLNDAVNFFLYDLYILEAGYASLYLYVYNVPSKYIKKFRELEPTVLIMDQLKEYVYKHSSIREEYYKFYFKNEDTSQSSSLLESFYNDISQIGDDNYNPEEVKNIMDSICLM